MCLILTPILKWRSRDIFNLNEDLFHKGMEGIPFRFSGILCFELSFYLILLHQRCVSLRKTLKICRCQAAEQGAPTAHRWTASLWGGERGKNSCPETETRGWQGEKFTKISWRFDMVFEIWYRWFQWLFSFCPEILWNDPTWLQYYFSTELKPPNRWSATHFNSWIEAFDVYIDMYIIMYHIWAFHDTWQKNMLRFKMFRMFWWSNSSCCSIHWRLDQYSISRHIDHYQAT